MIGVETTAVGVCSGGERHRVQFQKQQGKVGIYNQGTGWEMGKVSDENPVRSIVGDLAECTWQDSC